MKLKTLRLNNFAQFTDFECEFDGQVTHLVGVNGSGKTTVGLTAIWACLKGIAERTRDGQLVGERFRFIGTSKASADIELTVVDESTNDTVTIKNHITKQGNTITCEPVREEGWLNELLSVAFLSAKNFTQLSSKEQALLLGIDTSEIDSKIKEAKEEFTILNREYRKFGDIEELEPVDRVDVSQLVAEKSRLESDYYNKQRVVDEKNRGAKERNERRSSVRQKIDSLEAQLLIIQEQITEHEKWLDSNPELATVDPVNPPDTVGIQKQIDQAMVINEAASRYEENSKKKEEKASKEQEISKNKESQDKLQESKLSYIKSFDFGFDGLEVDDAGGLQLNGKPIREPYFSKGELEVVVAKLYASLNPELKVRFIDDFELLDEDNQARILDSLLDSGFQVITAEVGKKSVKPNTILLRECKVVEDYDNTKEKLL